METANRFVYDRQSEDSALSGMGTTLTVLWAGQAAMTVGHVGDSRAYLARNGTLTQITQDHSLVAELLRNGYIDAAEAANHPYRSVITRAIGSDRMIIPDVFTIPYHSEDRWLICSDGLYDMLDYSHIQDAVISGSVTEAADKLMDQALHNGGRDNISLVLVDCGKAGDADE
jgi:protein phosphatase